MSDRAHPFRQVLGLVFVMAGSLWTITLSPATAGSQQLTHQGSVVTVESKSPLSQESTGLTAASGAGQIRVLYVIPSDGTFRNDYATAVQDAYAGLQWWYREQLSGRTFTLFSARPEICWLPQPASYYAVETWSKVFFDVQACAPVAYGSPVVWILYVDVVHACNAPGRLGAGTTGLAMMPRSDLDALIGARIFGDCGEEYHSPISQTIGGGGHELGHALGLPHPRDCDAGLPTCDYGALMWAGYASYPATYLRQEEKDFLLASPFISPRAQRRAEHDFDGDGRTDATLFRPSPAGSPATWFERRSTTAGGYGVSWGLYGDVPTPADFDGDGAADPAVFRPSNGTWYVVQSTTRTGYGVQWGIDGDVPAPGDFDGDRRADPTLFRPSTGTWYVLATATGTGRGVQWGVAGDIPVPADYDGDGRTDVAVYRPTTGVWYIIRSSTGMATAITWGVTGDVPAVGDYDGDGKADPSVFRPSTGTWYELRSSTGIGYGVRWGQSGDLPVRGDFDGDGQADPTVFRPAEGAWYQLRSTSGVGHGFTWGSSKDQPIGSLPIEIPPPISAPVSLSFVGTVTNTAGLSAFSVGGPATLALTFDPRTAELQALSATLDGLTYSPAAGVLPRVGVLTPMPGRPPQYYFSLTPVVGPAVDGRGPQFMTLFLSSDLSAAQPYVQFNGDSGQYFVLAGGMIPAKAP